MKFGFMFRTVGNINNAFYPKIVPLRVCTAGTKVCDFSHIVKYMLSGQVTVKWFRIYFVLNIY